MTLAFEQTTLLIGIGAARTGTRWLSNYFATHPDVLMSPIRVLHYFDARYEPEAYGRFDRKYEQRLQRATAKRASPRRTETPKSEKEIDNLRDRVRMITDEGAYLDYFRRRWSGQKVFVDITPSYSFLGPEAFAGMNRIHDKVLFFFSMRNPIDRYWSALTKQRTAEHDFDLYAEFDDRIQKQFNKDYQTTIVNLESAVSPASVQYAFFEDFFNMRAITELCNFLGIAPAPAEFHVAMNKSEPFPLDPWRRALAYRKFEPVYRFVHDRYRGNIPESWLRDMEQFSGR